MKQWLIVGVLAAAVAGGSSVRAADAVSPGIQAPSSVPTGEESLGTVRIPQAVLADGKPLAAGTYRVRLTTQSAKPEVVGANPDLERWVEFLQGSQVKGREVVTIIPQDQIKEVAEGSPPARGSVRVEILKGDDYLRVWINHGGAHYLIHLPPAA